MTYPNAQPDITKTLLEAFSKVSFCSDFKFSGPVTSKFVLLGQLQHLWRLAGV
jgi:hypothetical protein